MGKPGKAWKIPGNLGKAQEIPGKDGQCWEMLLKPGNSRAFFLVPYKFFYGSGSGLGSGTSWPQKGLWIRDDGFWVSAEGVLISAMEANRYFFPFRFAL